MAPTAKRKTPRPKHRATDSRDYEPPIIPIEAINEAASELRADHPQVNDKQAQFVHLLVQTGKSPAQLAKLLGENKNWVYYNMSKAAVCDYRQALSLRVLGWDSAAALATMRSLLTAKSAYIRLEAARDLLDRAGMSVEPAQPRSAPVSLTFNLTSLAPPTQREPVTVEGEVEMGPVKPSQKQEGPLKNEAGLQGRGIDTHDQGLEGTSDALIDPFTV